MSYSVCFKRREFILREICDERDNQDSKWGGAVHDDRHNNHDWIAYIIKHVGKSIVWPFDAAVFRGQMIRVAALAVAAVEWVDRAND